MSLTIEEYCIKINLHTNETINDKATRYVYFDSDGYKYALSQENIKVMERRDSLPAKFYRNNPFTFDNIHHYIVINNIPITFKSYDSLFKTATNKMEFSCFIHGHFKKTWNDIKNGQYCPDCGIVIRGESRKVDFQHLITEFAKVGYEVKTDKYINNETPIEYICENHLQQGLQRVTWGNFISGKRCSHCSRERVRL